ncbi:MAG TPA: glycosyltransferase family 39 protein [Gemmatimonadales bacterium]|jgi:hypothetical protein
MAVGPAAQLTAATPAVLPRPDATLPAKRSDGLILLALLVVGAVLRGIDLGDGLWYDEIATLVRYVRRPLGEIVTRFDTQNQHMLYSILAHAAVRLFGEHPWTLRLPAAVFGVASIWAVWRLGVRITSRREALIAAGLISVSSTHVWFSQDARGYTMLLFFSVVGTGIFFDLLERGERRSGVAYAIVMALACWTQVAGAFVVAGHGLVWLTREVRGAWFARGPGDTRSFHIMRTAQFTPLVAMIGTGILSAVLYAPVLGAMTHTLAGPGATGGAPEWKSLGWFVRQAAGGLVRGIPGGWIALLVGGVVALVGVASYWRRAPIATLLLLAPGLVTAVVMLVTAHNLWPRLFFFAVGFAALIAVRGGFAICRMALGERGKMVATVGAILAGVASLATVPRVWAPKQDYGGAMRWLAQANTAREPVITLDMTRLPYRDYYQTSYIAADSEPQIVQAESQGHAWVLVTFPERLEAVDSATWSHLHCCYQEIRRFGGSVDGGTILVMHSR